jgi:predicted N-acyltransferase
MDDIAVSVRSASQHDQARWDGFIENNASVPPLNCFAWRTILEESYGVETNFLVAEAPDGDVVGVLPVYFNRTRRGRKCLFSLRFGLVSKNDRVAGALINEVGRICEASGVSSDLISSGYELKSGNLPAVSRSTLVLNISNDLEHEWRVLSAKTRNTVRKAEKSGVSVHQGREHLSEFYDIYANSLARKGFAIHTPEFFRSMARNLGDRFDLLVARHEGEIVGGTIVVKGPGVAMYPFQAAKPEMVSLAVIPLMVWKLMAYCAERGIFHIDMGESSPGSGTFKFKKNFGGDPTPLYYYSSLNDLSVERTDRAPTKAGKFHLAENLFLEKAPPFVLRQWALWKTKLGRII